MPKRPPYNSIYIKPRGDCKPGNIELDGAVIQKCYDCCRDLKGIPVTPNELTLRGHISGLQSQGHPVSLAV